MYKGFGKFVAQPLCITLSFRGLVICHYELYSISGFHTCNKDVYIFCIVVMHLGMVQEVLG